MSWTILLRVQGVHCVGIIAFTPGPVYDNTGSRLNTGRDMHVCTPVGFMCRPTSHLWNIINMHVIGKPDAIM